MLFGLAGICIRIGMGNRRRDNGHFMSVLVNCAVIGIAVLFAQRPSLTSGGVALFVLAGLATSFLGRRSMFQAIRLIGPTRQATVLVTAPVFAAIAGWAILGEQVRALQVVGALLISAGILVLIRSRAADPIERDTGTTTARGGIGAAGLGFLVALLAACSFGIGHVLRKAALEQVPSVLLGALIGVITAMAAILLTTSIASQTVEMLEANFRPVAWWFVLAGVITTAGMLLQFSVLEALPAWTVSLLQGTQVIWTLLLSYLLLRRKEPIDRYLLVSITLVITGTSVVAVQI